MSVAAEVLRPFWLKGINNISGKSTSSFKAWLADGNYFFQEVDVNNKLVFVPVNFDEMMQSVAHDINRMSIAAIETIHGALNPNEITRSSAWALIRSYYASFFASHALCRIFCLIIPMIDQLQSNKLNQAIKSSGWLGQVNYVTNDLYRVEIDHQNNIFRLLKLTKGSHESLWKEFGNLLLDLEDKILLNINVGTTSDRQDTVMLLRSIRNIIQSEHCTHNSNWLSYIRNNLNYRHDYGAWFPHDRSSKFRSSFTECTKNWKKDPLNLVSYSESQNIIKFSKGCILIVSLLHELILELEKRNHDNDSFLKYGVFHIL